MNINRLETGNFLDAFRSMVSDTVCVTFPSRAFGTPVAPSRKRVPLSNVVYPHRTTCTPLSELREP